MNPNEITEFKITVDLANRITNYLGTKPYKESAEFIDALRQGFQAESVKVQARAMKEKSGKETKK